MSPVSNTAETSSNHDTTEAFQLVQDLASQLSTGNLRLPSLPEVVIRIRRTLEKDDFDVDELARMVSSEAVLAGTILKLANSVTYRRSGAEVVNMPNAIARVGASMVRTASMNFALQQLRNAHQFKHIEYLLTPEWQRGKTVAGLCHGLARSSRKAHPDEMLLLGLVHNVGRIFILSHAEHYPLTFSNETALNDLMDHWHPSVGSAIAQSWNLPENAVQAIAEQATPDGEKDHCHAVSDLLQVAVTVQAIGGDDKQAIADAAALPASARLGVDEATLVQIKAQAGDWADLLG